MREESVVATVSRKLQQKGEEDHQSEAPPPESEEESNRDRANDGREHSVNDAE